MTLKLRWSDFKTITRSRTFEATNRDGDVWHCIQELFRKARTRPGRVRLVGVQLSNLVGSDGQLELALDAAARPAVGGALDAVRARFGFDAIRMGKAGGKSRWLGQHNDDDDD